ncbi:MAG TPA: M20/M25/M40 family metallo-hydrolase, partial [Caulobacteraceae bacterium]|nr:M20/M25/M40 family metallo-hydrolase [Caulobacteraceae bacterium]
PFVDLVLDAVERTTGLRPDPNTTGGTSDARFIRALCPVVEFGLVGTTMHAVNERTPTAEIVDLARAYQRIVERYFERFSS